MDALHMSEGAGVLDIDDEEFDRRENADGRGKGGGDEDEEEGYDWEEYEEDEEEEGDDDGGREMIEGEADEEYIVEDDLQEEGDDVSHQQPPPTDAAGVDATTPPRPPLQGIGYDEEVIERELVHEDEDEEGEDEERYVDPSIVALAAAQQDDDIILENARAPMTPAVRDTPARGTASSAIKRQVYDYLMNDRGEEHDASGSSVAVMTAQPPKAVKVIHREGPQDVVQSPSPTLPVTPLSAVAPVALGLPFADQGATDNTNNVGSDTNTDSAGGNDGMDYYFSYLMKDGDDGGGREQKEDRTKEELEEGDTYVMDAPSLLTAAAPPLLLLEEASPPGATENAVPSPLVQEHPLPTEFSSTLIHNYDEVHGTSSASPSPSAAESATESRSLTSRSKFKEQPSRSRRKRRDSVQPPVFTPVAAAAAGAFNVPVPTTPQFPGVRSISEDSLRHLSPSRPVTPPPPSEPPPSELVSRQCLSANFTAASAPVSSGMTASSMTSTLQEVNEYLGGEEAEKKLEETMDNIILKTRVQMLRETTKNLRCAKLVDVVFKDPENPVKPSEKELNRLKDAIATELTLNEFMASSKLCDVDSAEMFRESNEKLEMLQRKQIMANPLFSGACTKTTMSMNCGGRKPVLLHQKPVPIEGGGGVSTTGTEGEEEEQQYVPFDTRGNVQYNLHMELLDILDTRSKQHNSISRLGDRINFLNRLVEFKTSTGVSWFRLVNLLSGVVSKATAVIFGDAEPDDQHQQHQQRDNYQASSLLDEPSISSQLKAKSAETASSNDMDMSSIGVELFFGAALDILEKHLTRVCMDVGRLAIYLKIPVVLLKWPKVFTSTTSYKSLLLDSITRFSSKMSMSSMYIIDNIRFDDEKEAESPPATAVAVAAVPAANDTELFLEKDKKDAVRRVFENMRTGRASERDLAKELFVGSGDMNRGSSGIDSDMSVAYTAGASIIDYKTPVFENVMNSVVNYMEKRKHLISAAVVKLLRKAKLFIEVYCIQYKLKEVAKTKKNKTSKGKAPMRNLMFRTTMPTSPLSALTPYSTNAAPTTTTTTTTTSTTYNAKRPNPDIISSRIKRIRQWNPSPSSTSSCSP